MQRNRRDLRTGAALRLLASPRRRVVLRRLVDEEDGVASITELADAIVDAESPPTRQEPERVDRVVVDLHHAQLPKLADEHVVEYDARTGSVSYRPTESVEKLLRFLDEELE
ncbi:DUF7344 domain-containing protein [Halorarum salinum]|uniref:DUF7344 domain-containing protein n=1 Tax=Halorarum salinum TaxID=2743089 RepID=A0A7D5QEQ3_9EURY|nr:hypothetical protein [Halobaculum salinum]QLG60843.1 hypothetical protein HUG12_03410 [Halobaculum salinum]